MVEDSHALARRIAELALEKKAEDTVILDLRELSSACDYFVVASADNEQKVRAITEHIEDELENEGLRPWHVEGRSHRRWVLLDYVHVVVHVFHEDARGFYSLERLWAGAPREEVSEVASPGGESR
ncbi:MAG: ribosome silencing factor [Candidatus Eisenbacteria bacterium]|uniref:Ribosomal silencing factor RsfS n=1 Tax=Eiseniibacteriota bacterium TaxID=2212470 RepID=A0A956LZJ3_UNCEI|nr:ribosome silencing factor [Candidatus Eisenbacteria bacterium]